MCLKLCSPVVAPTLQVHLTGKDGVTIPDHEVITRKKQFRMKKERAEKNQDKKLKKKEAKAKKEEEKLAKKAAREAAKAEKLAAKESKGRKKGQTAKEKMEKRAKGSGKGGKGKKAKQTPSSSSGRKEHVDRTTEDPAGSVKCKTMKRYRRFVAALKGDAHQPPPNESEESPMLLEPKGSPKKGKGKKNSKSEKTAKETKGRRRVGKAKKTGDRKNTTHAKAAKTTAKSSSPESEPKQGRKRGKDEPSKPAAAAKSKTVKPNARKTCEVNEAAKQLALQTLHECKTSNCTHPNFQMPSQVTGVDFVPYWTRCAVGIKVLRKYLPNKKAQSAGKAGKEKGHGKAQIAYFGNSSPCIYASYEMAALWVSCLHFHKRGFAGFNACTGFAMHANHIYKLCLIVIYIYIFVQNVHGLHSHSFSACSINFVEYSLSAMDPVQKSLDPFLCQSIFYLDHI